MGQGMSREEMVYQAVQRADVSGIKRLRQDGASLEWRDSHGRTPLMIACSRSDTVHVAQLLLELGADVHAHCRGAQDGSAIHQATRKGLDRTLLLLMDYGADPLRPNDLGKRALDIAWEQHRPAMARIIEDRVALFLGPMRQQQLSGPAFLQALVPQWVYKKVWVSVVPGSSTADGRRSLRLNIYTPSSSMPTELLLHFCRLHLTKQDSSDPVLVVEDMQKAEKFKFSADRDARDPHQVMRLYNACQGITQRQLPAPSALHPSTHARTHTSQPPTATHPPSHVRPSAASTAASAAPSAAEDADFRAAVAESLRSAASSSSDMGGWADGAAASAANASEGAYAGWGTDQPHPFSPAAAAAASVAAAAAVSTTSSAGGSTIERTGAADDDDYNGWGAQPAPAAAAPAAPAAAPPPTGAGPAAAVPTPAAVPPPAAAAAAAAAGGALGVGAYAPHAYAPSAYSAPIPTPAAPPLPYAVAPSAPPLSPPGARTSHISYPTVDNTPVPLDFSPAGPAAAAAAAAATPVEMHPAYDPDRVQAELKRAESKKGGGQCVICWDAAAEAVCVPCGHVAGCMECLGEVRGKGWGCPVCRAPIEQVVKLFHV